MMNVLSGPRHTRRTVLATTNHRVTDAVKENRAR